MSAPIDFGQLYHTGIIVDDVESAKQEYTDLFGVTWGFQGEAEMPIWIPETGARTVNFRFAYSDQGPHRLELVGPIPGTLWSVPTPGHAHHLGYWCDDVAGTTAELVRRGVPIGAKVGVDDGDGDAPIVLFRLPTGAYIEIVSSALRETMFGPD